MSVRYAYVNDCEQRQVEPATVAGASPAKILSKTVYLVNNDGYIGNMTFSIQRGLRLKRPQGTSREMKFYWEV